MRSTIVGGTDALDGGLTAGVMAQVIKLAGGNTNTYKHLETETIKSRIADAQEFCDTLMGGIKGWKTNNITDGSIYQFVEENHNKKAFKQKSL